MVYLVTLFFDGESIEDECFSSLDEALCYKYEWQIEDDSNHYASIDVVDDRNRHFELGLDFLDKLIKVFSEEMGAHYDS